MSDIKKEIEESWKCGYCKKDKTLSDQQHDDHGEEICDGCNLLVMESMLFPPAPK